jgi:hypothetical protein
LLTGGCVVGHLWARALSAGRLDGSTMPPGACAAAWPFVAELEPTDRLSDLTYSLSSGRSSISIDFDNQLVRAEVPVNWTWIAANEVLFAHAAFAGGRQFLTQLYTLNLRTGVFEICDYGGNSDASTPCTRQYICRATSLAFDTRPVDGHER